MKKTLLGITLKMVLVLISLSQAHAGLWDSAEPADPMVSAINQRLRADKRDCDQRAATSKTSGAEEKCTLLTVKNLGPIRDYNAANPGSKVTPLLSDGSNSRNFILRLQSEGIAYRVEEVGSETSAHGPKAPQSKSATVN